jgi:hypothetical protein
MSAARLAPVPSITGIEPPRIAHHYPEALTVEPMPWTSICGQKVTFTSEPAPRNTPRCVVCVEMEAAGHP